MQIILDTDIGDDIDDALALAVALNSPEIELRGVTTVFADAPRRARLAAHILQVYGRGDVPVAAGCSAPIGQPLEHIPLHTHASPQFAVLPDEGSPIEFPSGVDFLVDAVNATADSGAVPLTIVTIGALTNIAQAIRRELAFASRCRIVMMGGQWMRQEPEWNIACDPEAAAIVFESGIDISMIGLDVTLRCQLTPEQQASFAGQASPPLKLLGELIRLWHNHTNRLITLHDPLTVLSLFDDCVKFEEKRLKVVLDGVQRGCTVVGEGAPNVRVAVDVDEARAVSLFMERVLRRA